MPLPFPKVEITQDWPRPGATATNSLLGGIKIWANTRFFGGVLAQEYWDWWFKVIPSIIASFLALVVFVLYADTKGASLFLVVAIAVALCVFAYLLTYLIWTRIGAVDRMMEGTGQAIEIVVAEKYYNADLDEWLDYEARVLSGYYKMFEGYSEPRARAYLVDRLPLARCVVEVFDESIQEMVQLGKTEWPKL